MKLRKTTLLFAVVTMVLMSGCGGGQAKKQLTAKEAGASEETWELYKQSCVSCHGADMQGRVGGNANLVKVGKRLNKQQIVDQITHGGGGMVAFGGKLSDKEIEQLADWLATRK